MGGGKGLGGIVAAIAIFALLAGLMGLGTAEGVTPWTVLQTLAWGTVGVAALGIVLLAAIVIAGIVIWRKKDKAKETERILNTPVKTFAEMEADELKKKYLGEDAEDGEQAAKGATDVDAELAKLPRAQTAGGKTEKNYRPTFEGGRNSTLERFGKKPAAGSWTCPSCGAKGITSNFCTNCGTKKPQ